ncbi:hypothetical protein [Clostridium butyricum]
MKEVLIINSKFDSNLDRYWFMSFCNNEEIDRIISPKNACDFLLQ